MNAPLNLNQFTGSVEFYRFGLTSSVMSQGVYHVAEQLGAYWLIQDIDLYVRMELGKKGLETDFVVAKLKPSVDGAAILTLEDGNYQVLFEHIVPFTDFDFDRVPDDFQIWVGRNDMSAPSWTLYLPQEH